MHILTKKLSRISVLFLAITAGIVFLSAAHAEQSKIREYQLKAAFLYNFARFVEWPEESFTDSDDTVNLCVWGKDPFGPLLDRVIEGKTARGRGLVIKRLTGAEEMKSCQIVFVSFSNENLLPGLLNTLGNTAVLTVGEGEGFARGGGVINFVIEEDKVRFEINVDAADRAGLKISSKLLKLARIVKDN